MPAVGAVQDLLLSCRFGVGENGEKEKTLTFSQSHSQPRLQYICWRRTAPAAPTALSLRPASLPSVPGRPLPAGTSKQLSFPSPVLTLLLVLVCKGVWAITLTSACVLMLPNGVKGNGIHPLQWEGRSAGGRRRSQWKVRLRFIALG